MLARIDKEGTFTVYASFQPQFTFQWILCQLKGLLYFMEVRWAGLPEGTKNRLVNTSVHDHID